MSPVSTAQLSAFLASMPPAYRTAFPEEAMADHARAVLERGKARAYVAACRSSTRPEEVAVCIVADDRPGLLATFSAALVMSDLDVIRAHAFTRVRADGKAEAVDLFWVRAQENRRKEPWGGLRLDELQVTLCLLLEGRVSVEEVARRRGHPARPSYETRVRFLDGVDGGLGLLEVETADRTGLLLALAQALYKARVSIVRAEVDTKEGRVLDRFHVTELGGTPISSVRRLKVQVAVLGAIQPDKAPVPEPHVYPRRKRSKASRRMPSQNSVRARV